MRTIEIAAFLCLVASPCVAQVYIGRPVPRAGSIEITGGIVAAGGKDLPDVTATLTRNPGTGLESLDWFQSDATLTPALGGQARLGVYLTPSMSIEGGFQYARPKVEARLTADFESAPDTTASETVSSYVFTGSLLYHFGRASDRMRPFVMGGGGHVRDARDGNRLVETGTEFHGGGGFKWWFSNGRRKIGLRGEVIASVRGGGVATEDNHRIVPTAAFSLAYLF